MKKILLFAFLLCSFSAFAQYPATPTTKQELGRQTTGDGLIYRGSGAPAYTPSNNRNAWIYYDTTNNRLYKSRLGSWSLMVQDTSAFNEIQMPYIVDDTLYLTGNVTGEPLTAYVNRVWPIAALSDTASITGENQGDVAFVTGGTAVAFRGSSYWNPFSGGGGGGSFNSFDIAGDSGSSTITDGETATIAGGYGINTAESGGTVMVTADTSELVTPYDISGLPSGTGTNQRIVVWTGTNSQGNSTQLQSAAGVTLDANLAYRITGGTTASRPTGAAGMMYWNTSNTWWDYHNGTAWFNPLRSATATGLGTAANQVFYANSNLSAATSTKLEVDEANDGVLIKTNSSGGYKGLAHFHNTSTFAGGQFIVFRSRGSFGLPTALAENDLGFLYSFRGHHNSGYAVDNATFGTKITGPVSGSTIPASWFFTAGTAAGSYNTTLLIHHSGKVQINTGSFLNPIAEPARTLHVTGEVRITDLDTDTPTKIAMADNDGDMSGKVPGFGLALAADGTPYVDSTKISTATDLGAYLPLTLTGTTTFNTSGNLFNVQGRMSFVSSAAETWPITFLSQEYDGIDFQQNRGSNSVYGDLIGGFQCRPRYNGAISGEVASITGRYTGNGTTRRGEMVVWAHNGSGLYQSGIFGGDTTILKPAQLFIAAPNSQNGLEVNNQKTVRLPGYGVGGKEAADLSKTNSAYIQSFATDGTEIEATAGAGLIFSSGVLSTSQSFFNDYDNDIALTGVTGTADTLDADSNVKSNDWLFNPSTNTYTYNGVSGRYYSVSLSAQVSTPSGSGENFVMEVFKNGTATSCEAQTYLSAVSVPFSMHGQAILLFSIGDTINVKVSSTASGGEDFDLENYSLIIKEI